VIDIHNHLLFGVDDGMPTMEGSIEVLTDMYKYGYSSVILTPHYITNSRYNSSAKENFHRLKLLRDELKNRNIPLKLYLGNEIFIDDNIYELLKNGEIYSLNGTSYILVELPMDGEYSDYIEVFKDLMSKGCHVILAHPERYLAFQKDYKKVNELIKIGVYLQSNIDSLIGKYGPAAEKMIKKLLSEKKIAFLATDIHRRKHNYTDWNKAKEIALKYISEDEYDTLVHKNPSQLVSD
jgi:protein-tyrosine phosphatase